MRRYDREFGRTHVAPGSPEIGIGDCRYRAEIGADSGWVVERCPDGEKKYRIEYALGGKNVYYFLTPLERGRLQTLPLAYDVAKREWFDMTSSGVRHAPGVAPERPLFWKDWPYTFNTSCFGCHVSQLSTNYDQKTDTYHTGWIETGINCETCHGPSAAHVAAFEHAPNGRGQPDVKIVVTSRFTPDQHVSACSSCHAKLSPITAGYAPGGRFFDHFDLATLEDADFYPDGRDLGENYTYTSWMIGACTKSAGFHCLACHTSSGRYRFASEDRANDACAPCHRERVAHAAAHSHHKPGSPASRCVSCHMPKTRFAGMERSDHSMIPPAPAATLRFKSPNACNICHADKPPDWADRWVRRWFRGDYQAPLLYRAGLIDAARRRDWSRLPEMLKYLQGPNRQDIFANSLIRLLASCDDAAKWPVILKAAKDPSPLIRSSAVESLSGLVTPEATRALVEAAGDDYRLVRIRAAAALTGRSDVEMTAADKENARRSTQELVASMTSRLDQWSSRYNLGNHQTRLGNVAAAVDSYKMALKLDRRQVPAWVNLAMAWAQQGERARAEEALRTALGLDSTNAEANFDMGLLQAESKDFPQAERYLRAALRADPRMAEAAFNLCVVLAGDRITEAVSYCRQAVALRPDEPRYGYTLAYYLSQHGEADQAIATLRTVVARVPHHVNSYLLLAAIHEREGRSREAAALCRQALRIPNLAPADRVKIEVELERVGGR